MDATVGEIHIPKNSSEITPKWLEVVTGLEVGPEALQIEGEIQAGLGFLSSMCRVEFKTKAGDVKKIIIKLLPTDPKWLELALADGSDEREINFYSIALPGLLEVIPEFEENVCKIYHGSVRPADAAKGLPKASILIMEDLKSIDYEMMNFSGDSRAVNSLITCLTRYHVGSLAVEACKGKPMPELYPFMQGGDKNFTIQMKKFCDDGYVPLRELLSSEGVSNEVIECYEKLQPYTEVMVNIIDDKSKTAPCMVHGDIWPPNTQVHNSLPIKLIDWQLVGYRNPTIDLINSIYLILPQEELNLENVRRLVKLYQAEAEKLCKDKGLEDKIKLWDWEEFDKFCFTWGASFLFMLMLGSMECMEKDKAKYANVFRVMCEENKLPQFLLRECKGEAE